MNFLSLVLCKVVLLSTEYYPVWCIDTSRPVTIPPFALYAIQELVSQT